MKDEIEGGGDTTFTRRLLRIITAVVSTAILLLVARYEGDILFVILAGALFALVLKAVGEWISDRSPIPYKAAVACTVVLLMLLFGVAAWQIGPRLGEQIGRLSTDLPKAAQSVVDKAGTNAWFRQWVGSTPQVSELKPEAKTLVTGATTAVASGSAVVGGLLAVFFFGVYGALQPSMYSEPLLRLIPLSKRARARQVLEEISRSLTRWLLGRLVAMVFVGILATVAFWLLHIPMALTLGILAGLLTFIEYLGAILSAIPALLLALTQGTSTMVWVLVLFTFIHLVEGYVLTPLLARRAVHFPSGFTLAVQLLFGAIFGPLGLTFATPVSVMVIILVKMLYVEDVLGDRGVQDQQPVG